MTVRSFSGDPWTTGALLPVHIVGCHTSSNPVPHRLSRVPDKIRYLFGAHSWAEHTLNDAFVASIKLFFPHNVIFLSSDRYLLLFITYRNFKHGKSLRIGLFTVDLRKVHCRNGSKKIIEDTKSDTFWNVTRKTGGGRHLTELPRILLKKDHIRAQLD